MATAKLIILAIVVTAMFWAVLAYDLAKAFWDTAILGRGAVDQLEGEL